MKFAPFLALALLIPGVARAADTGSPTEVRAIRHDLPIILAARLYQDGLDPQAFRIDQVAVADGAALAQWHDGRTVRMAILGLQLGQWWLRNNIYIYDDGSATADTEPCGDKAGPATSWLSRSRDITAGLLPLVKTFPIVANADTLEARHGAAVYAVICDVMEGVPSGGFPVPHSRTELIRDDHYKLYTAFASTHGPDDIRITQFLGRAPTQTESWTARCGNAYYYFSLTMSGSAVTSVDAGTTIDVWFPFALDPSKTYSLTIAHTTPAIGPVNGSLARNTLHFVLPAFALQPDAELMGEIDGDPLDNC